MLNLKSAVSHTLPVFRLYLQLRCVHMLSHSSDNHSIKAVFLYHDGVMGVIGHVLD